MHRNIVLFSDGTGNGSASLFKTNVRRLYEALDLTDPEHPREPRQFAFYDDGVGNSSFRPFAIMAGAVGLGLARNVRDLYAFLCRTYRPGDRIYAFGFSRGAFTVRALCGLVLNQGLVRYDGDEAEFRRGILAAFRANRRRYTTAIGHERVLRDLRDRLIAARDRARGRAPYRREDNIAEAAPGVPLEVEFVGVWDTVDAYGLPVEELTRAWDRFVWPLRMPDLNLNPRVRRARHALALDDERNTFHPRLWNEATEPGGNAETRHIDRERISQVWFAGAHADVGGGYPEDSLSHVSLKWMMDEAEKHGLRFSPATRARLRALEDESGTLHDSRRGLAGYYRYNPRRIERLTRTREVAVARTKIHESVFRRIRVGQDGYAPLVLPPRFAVVRLGGAILPGDGYAADASGDPGFYGRHVEHPWNHVWWRRLAYFLTLGATLGLVLMPLGWPGLEGGGCEGSALCFAAGGFEALSAVLPGFATAWTDSFASHPDVAVPLALLVLLGLLWGRRLEGRVRDSMRAIWYRVPRLRPEGVAEPPPLRQPGAVNRAVERLRTRPGYGRFFRALTHGVLPAAFLVGLLYLAVALVGRAAFSVAASGGWICEGAGDVRAVGEEGRTPASRVFRTADPCAPTGLRLEAGAAYRLRLAIPGDGRWFDLRQPAGPNGVHPRAVTAGMIAGTPLRRHLGQPWFRPMARIGARGADTYVLEPRPAVATDVVRPEASPEAPCPERGDGGGAACPDIVFEAELVARSSGELFLYVNDGLPLLPGTGWPFYRNNLGSARLGVERLGPSER